MNVRRIGLSPANEAKLFDALTGQRCESLHDVAAAMGETVTVTKYWITRQRAAATAGLSWWTIPHGPRGRGPSLFRAVEVNSIEVMPEEDHALIVKGRLSSMKAISTEARNVVTVCRIIGEANYLPVPMRVKCLVSASLIEQAVTTMDSVVRELEAFPQLTLAV